MEIKGERSAGKEMAAKMKAGEMSGKKDKSERKKAL